MLKHNYRFHGHKSLGFVFRQGLVVRDKHLIMRIHKHPNRVHSRVAVVVSKKISKRAPDRNRIRRRIYETVRTSWNDMEAPYDIVFVAMSAELIVLPADDVRQEIVRLLRQGHLLHTGNNVAQKRGYIHRPKEQ